jgi:predicted ester cyclase
MENSIDRDPHDHPDIAERAKQALELVCAGKALDKASRYYGEQFVDHVNGMKFQGREGVRQSVQLYTRVLSDLHLDVKEQFTDGDRVTSRFVVSGKALGKEVRFNGITISLFKDGMIIEDWSVTDSLSMLRQLGVWRSLVVAMRQWKAIRHR